VNLVKTLREIDFLLKFVLREINFLLKFVIDSLLISPVE